MHKKFCPITKQNCLRSQCTLWIKDYSRVTDLKERKLKDSSNCAFQKMGEESSMNIWRASNEIA
jgi:hypothetical protein